VSRKNIDSDGHDYYDVNYNKHYDDCTCDHCHDDYSDRPALRADRDGHEHLGGSAASTVVVPTSQSTANANGQTQQIGALQITT